MSRSKTRVVNVRLILSSLPPHIELPVSVDHPRRSGRIRVCVVRRYGHACSGIALGPDGHGTRLGARRRIGRIGQSRRSDRERVGIRRGCCGWRAGSGIALCSDRNGKGVVGRPTRCCRIYVK